MNAQTSTIRYIVFLLSAGCLVSCSGAERDRTASRPTVSVLLPSSEKLFWEPIAEAFEQQNPSVDIDLIEGPQSTGLREDLYTTSLLARDHSFDLVYMDVTWTSKFAMAGWLLPLDAHFLPPVQAAFLDAAINAGRFEGTLYRIPVRTDLGVLYYRSDWLADAGLEPPTSLEELILVARDLQAPPDRWGFVWPGKQYEGLVCFFLEILRAHGGYWIGADTRDVGLDHDEAVLALEFLVNCVGDAPISPPGVTTYQEEESRRVFHEGHAVFLRNWPYVWRLSQQEGSPLRGRVGVMALPATAKGTRSGTLGGWGLGVSSYSRYPEQAISFIRFVASLEGQRLLCAPTGYAPSLRASYDDAALLRENPFLPTLLALHQYAVARPVVPQYALASDILQRHLTSALSGSVTAREALTRATRETRAMLVANSRADATGKAAHE